jgi:hypothetical protein
MTREELIKNVALKMDEISSSDDVIVPVGTGDNNPLYTQINNLLNESVNDVLMKAPIFRLQSQVASLTTIAIGEGEDTEPATLSETLGNYEFTSILGGLRKAAVISMPSDFIRLASINDTSFQRPIVDLAIEGDMVDNRQHNKFLVAKSAKPVAVIGRDSTGNRTITCYSYSASATDASLTFNYIKRYENKNATEDSLLDDYLIDIVTWVCAGKVFAAQGDINKGKLCDENAAALMI